MPPIVIGHGPMMTAYLPIVLSRNNNSKNSRIITPKARNIVSNYEIKPLNLEGGQCAWCGKYGHQRRACPLLK